MYTSQKHIEMGNDTADDSNGYDRSNAVSGVKETWVSGFMSGLAHHVSNPKFC